MRKNIDLSNVQLGPGEVQLELELPPTTIGVKSRLDGKLNALAKQIHDDQVERGWYEIDRSFGDVIALFHSELSEALEEHRSGHAPTEIYYDTKEGQPAKPEGIPIELADLLIRVLDSCAVWGIDIEDALRMKCQYNRTRSHRHGGKRI